MTRFGRMLCAAAIVGAIAGTAWADDPRGGELGLLLGGVSVEDVVAGPGSTGFEPTLGIRGGSVFSRHWGWYVDVLVSEWSSDLGYGDLETVIGRTGFEYLFSPEQDMRWFVTGGAGWMTGEFALPAFDFHRPLASAGFGQRIRLSDRFRLRWELRADTTLDDARLGGQDLFMAHALVGLVWGPNGTGGPRVRPVRPVLPPGPDQPDRPVQPLRPERAPAQDLDGDGVRDSRDRCPGSLPGALVDGSGCALDGDGDGVPDGIDRCPASESDVTVGPDGCRGDADGDGVPDISDVCPNTPQGARVDEWGCPKDRDRDGVPDGRDRCPGTTRGAEVNEDGCPIDGDGDGVPDGRDRCPDTAEGVSVNVSGCPLQAPPPRAAPVFDRGSDTVVLEGVRFESNSAVLKGDSTRVLDRVARSLLDSPDVRVEIGGHTDSSGSAAHNMDLSSRRAVAVRDYLINRGISASRLDARGYGESQPVADETTPDGRARNRRVELVRRD